MGGMTTTLIQAKSKAFKAIALLGSNAGGLDWGLNDHEKTYIDKPDRFSEDIEKLVYAKVWLRVYKNTFWDLAEIQ